MMRDIDVTPILDEDCGLLSASVAELGQDAGQITWRNCISLAEERPLVTDANRDDIRDYFRRCGAWDDEEIAAWSDVELSAMVWQEAAACMREFEDCGGDLETYRRKCEEGTCSGRLHIVEGEPRTAWLYVGV